VGVVVSKALDLARLAADERTPIHEREAAALQLAKIVARDGVPASRRVDYDYRSDSRAMSIINDLHGELAIAKTLWMSYQKETEELRARVRQLEERWEPRDDLPDLRMGGDQRDVAPGYRPSRRRSEAEQEADEQAAYKARARYGYATVEDVREAIRRGAVKP
jgi:hypothetical protein